MHAASPEIPEEPTVTPLLARMRDGDRDAVGEFIDLYGERIRRRVRGRLGPTVRSVFDSQEILSTVARRLDELVNTNRLRANEEDQLWSLVYRIATNASTDKSKFFKRLRQAEGPDRVFAGTLLSELERSANKPPVDEDDHFERLIGSVSDPIDRQILEMWLRGMALVAIAQSLELPPGTVRRRWAEIKAELEPRIRRGLA